MVRDYIASSRYFHFAHRFKSAGGMIDPTEDTREPKTNLPPRVLILLLTYLIP